MKHRQILIVLSLTLVSAILLLQLNHIVEAQEIAISFTQPTVFRCGATISWNDLSNWIGQNDPSVCANGPYYTVAGNVNGAPQAIRIKAEFFVPEVGQAWPAAGGGLLTVNQPAGTFSGNFCISQKGPDREFWFQVYAENLIPVGAKCVIKVTSKIRMPLPGDSPVMINPDHNN